MMKIVKSLSIIMAVVAVVAGGTYAWELQKEEVKGVSIAAGSADLMIDASISGDEYDWKNGFTVPIEALIAKTEPGSSGHQVFDIKNVGDSNGKTSIRFAMTSNKENTRLTPEIEAGDSTYDVPENEYNGGELADNIKFAFKYKQSGQSDWSELSNYYTLSEYNNNSNMLPLGDIGYGENDMTENGVANVDIHWMIPEDAGNEIMTDSVTFNIVFGLEQ